MKRQTARLAATSRAVLFVGDDPSTQEEAMKFVRMLTEDPDGNLAWELGVLSENSTAPPRPYGWSFPPGEGEEPPWEDRAPIERDRDARGLTKEELDRVVALLNAREKQP